MAECDKNQCDSKRFQTSLTSVHVFIFTPTQVELQSRVSVPVISYRRKKRPKSRPWRQDKAEMDALHSKQRQDTNTLNLTQKNTRVNNTSLYKINPK